MATVVIEFGYAMAPQPKRQTDAPVADPQPSAESITSSGTSQATTMTAEASQVASIHSDGAVWVQFGASPTASAGNDAYIGANERRDFGPIEKGWKVAVIDA